MKRGILGFLFAATIALPLNLWAQREIWAQTQQQPTPSQVAIQLVTVINSWAQAIEALQAENAKLKARVEELEKQK